MSAMPTPPPGIARCCLALAIAMSAGCATTEGDLKRLRLEVKELRGRRSALQRSLGPLKRHEKRLKAGRGLGTVAMVGKQGLLALAKASLPHKFAGKTAHPKLQGSFTLSRPYDVRIQADDTVALRMVLVGRNVGISMAGYDSHKKKIKAALAAGAIVDVTARLTVDRARNKLYVYLRCTDVHFKKHNDSTYTDAVRKGLNAKVFRSHAGVALPTSPKGGKAYLFTTPHHVVIGREG